MKYILSSKEFKKDKNKKFVFYIGSKFSKDIQSDEYNIKILNKIKSKIEQNKILILKDMEDIYINLYDLFDKNFTIINKKKYARITFDEKNEIFSSINDDFKCIILINEKSLEKVDYSFLNMFDKHIISLRYLLDKTFLNEIDIIYNILQDFTKTNFQKNKINIKYNIKNLLINCEKEELQGLVFKKVSELVILGKKLSNSELVDIILEKISPTIPQDIILLLKYSGFEKIYPKIYDKVLNYYQTAEHSNFYNFLKTMKYRKNIIYTFSNIEKPLFFNKSDKIDSTLLGNIDIFEIYDVKCIK